MNNQEIMALLKQIGDDEKEKLSPDEEENIYQMMKSPGWEAILRRYRTSVATLLEPIPLESVLQTTELSTLGAVWVARGAKLGGLREFFGEFEALKAIKEAEEKNK